MAEPLSLAAGIGSLLAFATKVIVSTNELAGRYESATITIESIVAECRAVSVLLTQIERLFREHENSDAWRGEALEPINDSLFACERIFQVLDADLKKLNIPDDQPFRLTRANRWRSIWNHDRLDELTKCLRAQANVLHIFVSILNNQTNDEILREIRGLNEVPRFNRELETTLRLSPLLLADGNALSEGSGSIFRLSDRRAQSLRMRRNRDESHTEEATAPSSSQESSGNRAPVATAPATVQESDRHHATSTVWGYTPSVNTVGEQFISETNDLFEAIVNHRYERLENLVNLRGNWFLPIRDGNGHTPILLAVHNSDVRSLQILTRGLGLEAKCRNAACGGLLPIHIAASRDAIECLDYLLNHNARFDSLADQQQTALHIAARDNSPAVVERLLASGLSLLAKDAHGDMATHCAARQKSLGFLRALMQSARTQTRYPDLLEHPNSAGKRVLQITMETGWIDGFHYLKDSAGANFNARDAIEATLMHNAARCSILDVIPELKDLGLELNAKDKFGMTPLHHAVLTPYPSTMIALLHESGADLETRTFRDPFSSHSSIDERVAAAKTFSLQGTISVDAEPTAATGRGLTPLMLASMYSPRTIVKMLLDAGANRAAMNTCGCSILYMSRSNPDNRVFRLIAQESLLGNQMRVDNLPADALLALFVASSKAEFLAVRSRILTRFGSTHLEDRVVGTTGDCHCGDWQMNTFRDMIRHCADPRLTLAGENVYLGKTLISYLAESDRSEELRWLLDEDATSRFADDTAACYRRLKRRDNANEDVLRVLREAYDGSIERAEAAEAEARRQERTRIEEDIAERERVAREEHLRKQMQLEKRQRRKEKREHAIQAMEVAAENVAHSAGAAMPTVGIIFLILVLLAPFIGMVLCWTMFDKITTANGECPGCEKRALKLMNGGIACTCVLAVELLFTICWACGQDDEILAHNAATPSNSNNQSNGNNSNNSSNKKVPVRTILALILLVAASFVGLAVSWTMYDRVVLFPINCTDTEYLCKYRVKVLMGFGIACSVIFPVSGVAFLGFLSDVDPIAAAVLFGLSVVGVIICIIAGLIATDKLDDNKSMTDAWNTVVGSLCCSFCIMVGIPGGLVALCVIGACFD